MRRGQESSIFKMQLPMVNEKMIVDASFSGCPAAETPSGLESADVMLLGMTSESTYCAKISSESSEFQVAGGSCNISFAGSDSTITVNDKSGLNGQIGMFLMNIVSLSTNEKSTAYEVGSAPVNITGGDHSINLVLDYKGYAHVVKFAVVSNLSGSVHVYDHELGVRLPMINMTDGGNFYFEYPAGRAFSVYVDDKKVFTVPDADKLHLLTRSELTENGITNMVVQSDYAYAGGCYETTDYYMIGIGEEADAAADAMVMEL